MPDNARCEACKGIGYTVFDEKITSRRYCACPLGRELERSERIERRRAAIVSESGRGLGGPATAEEIAAAPRWLRQLEGFQD
jgi:hypothetical protein